ncbi:MAG: DJ-1/PfpI family protein [Chloroflexi bacterium]|jgi:transcriptional regulator GlxA family with amidase domain|nr:DJ-1/PfpI family protein [Chloroflexota bacterium]
MARNVLIVLFDDVDTLDFTGPLEVFSITGQRATGLVPFTATMVAERRSPPITTRSGLRVIPYYTFQDAARADILLVPGGLGARHERNNPAMIEYIQQQAEGAEIVMSICTGALLLGAAGLLKGLRATTHHGALGELATISPDTLIVDDQRFVDNGQIITSAGITAGIDTALYVVQRLLGPATALETAQHMEYHWQPVDVP